MRVLFSAAPLTGRSSALLPLARAFAARGDRIAFLSPCLPGPAVQELGFAHLHSGPAGDLLQGPGAAASRLEAHGERSLHLAQNWRPDLVINEPYDFTGVFVAQALRRPLATVANGPAAPADYVSALTGSVTNWFTRHRLTPPGTVPAGQWMINTRPEALGAWPVPAGVTALTLRAPRREGREPLPPAGRRPRVVVALGAHFGDRSTVHRVLNGLTTGRHPEIVVRSNSLATTSPLSKYVTRAAFRPSSDRIGQVGAALVHGGGETVLNLLSQGIPLAVLPLGPGQFVEAVLTQRAGCGVAVLVPPGQLKHLDTLKLRSVMAEVMGNPWYRANAERVQQEMAAMPSAPDVAETIARTVDPGPRIRPARIRLTPPTGTEKIDRTRISRRSLGVSTPS
ncbi:salmochelin biosynthesis C-glycosyltransferase IroB [Kineosporia mesophila]|uniref:Salmochelin biosynthesis C-glycosyltransferase IroB n=1 Tax=Kineosporia mesophila TaxID=566012 RepID=A0ABP6ZW35_9ACTN|nr:nucleotide disphospho-sugar-binding domain-containing protein [Kineosporia mesophila]MCD5348771.1 hypothetical protein [Kineosporia mesophila]